MITLDVNPRVLVASITSAIPTPSEETRIYPDAIFVPFRDRPWNLLELLANLPDVDMPIFLLPSPEQDVGSVGESRKKQVEYLRIDDPLFLTVLQNMHCTSNRMCVSYFGGWDLPAKRNFAIWYARTHRMKRILLLDDDVRGLEKASLVAGTNALQQFFISGYFVDDFADHSVIDHAELASGQTVHTFLSGSCLFIRTDGDIGFFPPIYNEDWLFMIPKMARGQVCSLGSICQKAYDPFRNPLTAAFQEPGEVIAGGLIALLASDQYDQRFDHRTWRALLSLRRKELEALLDYPLHTRVRAAVQAARTKCAELRDVDCVRLLTDLENDQQIWVSALKELD